MWLESKQSSEGAEIFGVKCLFSSLKFRLGRVNFRGLNGCCVFFGTKVHFQTNQDLVKAAFVAGFSTSVVRASKNARGPSGIR